ncbi:MAG: acyltransferase [Alteraurantiacibacter sp.]
MAADPTRRHFTDLDGMRGLLALVVMLYHFGSNTVLNRFVPVGQVHWDLCVDFFFALSGFVLCRSVVQTGVGPALFAWRRVGRLLPMHLVILALFFLVLYPQGVPPSQLALELTAFGPLLGEALANNPAWSMTFELYLPIMLVAALALLGPPGTRASAAAIALLVAVLVWLTWLMFTGRVYPLEPWIEWARAVAGLSLGFACWLWWSAREQSARADHPFWGFPLCCLAFCLLVLFGTRVPLLALPLPLVIVATLFVGTRSHSVFSSWPARWLGRLSFGVYMAHWPVLLAFQARFGLSGLEGNVLLKGAMIAATLALALALHLLVEKPAMRRFRDWPGAPGPPLRHS